MITIGEDRFLLDTANDLLQLERSKAHTIRFADMEDKGTHYAFRYDPDTKDIFTYQDGPYIAVELQPLKIIDPEGMSRRYGVPLREMENMTDYDIIVKESLVQRRLDGNLPTIDIEGYPFYVDLRMQSLRPHNDFSTRGITFEALLHYQAPDDSGFLFPYDPKKREVATIDFKKVTAIPQRIVPLHLPPVEAMDPIGFALRRNLDLKLILRHFPPVENRKARRATWEETGIRNIIQENIRRSQKPDEERRWKWKPRLRL